MEKTLFEIKSPFLIIYNLLIYFNLCIEKTELSTLITTIITGPFADKISTIII